ncbi:MAG TPA: hypothetical protein VK154_19285 [Chitinophagales bacterium]|nr:hypothetical protein [Chitinophagales bacterium]
MKFPSNRAFAFILLLVAIGAVWLLSIGNTAIDIQLHDTNFVIEKTHLAVLLLTPFAFIYLLVKAIRQRFKIVTTNLYFTATLAFIAFLIYQAVLLQKKYIEFLSKLDVKMFPNKNVAIASANSNENLIWTAFFITLLLVAMVVIRTFYLVKQKESEIIE